MKVLSVYNIRGCAHEPPLGESVGVDVLVAFVWPGGGSPARWMRRSASGMSQTIETVDRYIGLCKELFCGRSAHVLPRICQALRLKGQGGSELVRGST